MLGMFTENHLSKFDVVANSREEALQYIDEVVRFADSGSKKIIECREQPLKYCSELPIEFEIITNRGVLITYPFRLN